MLLEDLFEEVFYKTKRFNSRFNAYNKDNDLVIVYDVAGIDKENIIIETEDNQITVKGKVNRIEYDEIIVENFRQSDIDSKVTVSGKYDLDSIKTDYKNGLLFITVTRREKKKSIKLI